MVATLRGRMKKFTLDAVSSPLSQEIEPDYTLEVTQVLEQVGYSNVQAMELIAAVIQKNPNIKNSQELIQEIFKMKNNL